MRCCKNADKKIKDLKIAKTIESAEFSLHSEAPFVSMPHALHYAARNKLLKISSLSEAKKSFSGTNGKIHINF